MKIILKEYLASLRERGDLDKAVLPNLLSELGLQVLNSPMIGTRQHGVDIAAVGKIKGRDTERCLYLFCIKAGNVSRSEWDGSPQSVYAELNEAREVYVPKLIAKEHAGLPIKICLCCGGEIEETVRINWASYQENHATERLSFEEWNGDLLAEFMMQSLIARELMTDEARRNLQKAVAMVNEPEACYAYTRSFLGNLLSIPPEKKKEQLLALRQAYIGLHTISAWAIEADNLESVYRISELGMLYCWHFLKDDIPTSPKATKHQQALTLLLDQFVNLYLRLSEQYFLKSVYPLAEVLHGLSVSVRSRESVDENLALFEILGRLAIRGHWTAELADHNKEANPEFAAMLVTMTEQSVDTMVRVINNNPTLTSPVRDEHMIEIAIVMRLAQLTGAENRLTPWLHSVCERTAFALLSSGAYPICSRDYADLLAHPVSKEQSYRDEVCSGSILYPYLYLWFVRLAQEDEVKEFVERITRSIPNCTHQAWMPDEQTDAKIWIGDDEHGVAVTGLNPGLGEQEMLDLLNEALSACTNINTIGAFQAGLTSLFLTACRHHRMPVPPVLWIAS